MKVFISWSGEFSKKVAEVLHRSIPCIIQSAEVFFSPEDIEKGESWDPKITSELSLCNYGIVCLTPDNVNAPWIHFEAGALATSLESRVSPLMININPSDIKGPLKRFQATKFNNVDLKNLLECINKNTENQISPETLSYTFEMFWPKIEAEIQEIINEYNNDKKEKKTKKVSEESEAIEEILQLLRRQNNLLTSPTELIPREYLCDTFMQAARYKDNNRPKKGLFDFINTYIHRLNILFQDDEMIELKSRYSDETVRFLNVLIEELRNSSMTMRVQKDIQYRFLELQRELEMIGKGSEIEDIQLVERPIKLYSSNQ